MVQSSRFPEDQKPTVHSRGKSGEGLKEGDEGTDVEEWALSHCGGQWEALALSTRRVKRRG